MAAALEQESLSQHIYRALDDGQKSDSIVIDLIDKGHEAAFVKELVQETSKLRYARRRAQGLALILLGAIICLVSCILTITSASAGNLSTILFGLTSVGIVVVFAGFVKVF